MVTKQHPSAAQEKPLVKKAEDATKKTLTLLWDDLPEWMHDNHYIHSGYRPQSNSYIKSLASLGYVNNESVNIYTHLVGAILAACAAIVLYVEARPRFGMATPEDLMVFSCFFLGAVACLGMSATYHTIMNHSEAVEKFGNRLDYIGIVVMIWGSFVPCIYYGFSDEPGLVRLYWTMITTFAAGTLVVVLYPKEISTPAWRPFRAFMFVAMGLSAVAPILHGLKLYGYKQLEDQMGLSWVVLEGVLYITGAVLYATRVPERLKPGGFDIWGNSHQIFHVLVLMAAASHFIGLLKAFDYEHSHRAAIMSSYSRLSKLVPPG